MLVFLSQQAIELLVTLTEVGLTRREGLVALTQLLVQLLTNTHRKYEGRRRGIGTGQVNQRWNFTWGNMRQKSLMRSGEMKTDICFHVGMFTYFHSNIKDIC